MTADRHTFFKFMLRSISEKHGLGVTMMPKPFIDRTCLFVCYADVEALQGQEPPTHAHCTHIDTGV